MAAPPNEPRESIADQGQRNEKSREGKQVSYGVEDNFLVGHCAGEGASAPSILKQV